MNTIFVIFKGCTIQVEMVRTISNLPFEHPGPGIELLEADGAWHQKMRVLPLARTC